MINQYQSINLTIKRTLIKKLFSYFISNIINSSQKKLTTNWYGSLMKIEFSTNIFNSLRDWHSPLTFHRNVVSTWSSGTGAAGVVGALSYTLLKKLGLRNALLVMLVVPFLMAISFWLILAKPSKKASFIRTQRQILAEEVRAPLKAFAKKLRLVPGLLRFMVPLGLVYFFEYFINQGTVSSVVSNAMRFFLIGLFFFLVRIN